MIKKIFIILSLLICTTCLFSAVPPLINYQGKLSDSSGNPVSDGTYSMIFKIYNVEIGDNAIPCGDPGANCLWEETQNVQTKNGIYSVLLGNINPLTSDTFNEANRWLGVKVGTDSEVTPRQKFTSVAYAFEADSANDCEGFLKMEHVDGTKASTGSESEVILKTYTMEANTFNSIAIVMFDMGFYVNPSTPGKNSGETRLYVNGQNVKTLNASADTATPYEYLLTYYSDSMGVYTINSGLSSDITIQVRGIVALGAGGTATVTNNFFMIMGY